MNFELCFEGRVKKVVGKEKAKPGGGNSTMKATRPEKRVKELTLGGGEVRGPSPRSYYGMLFSFTSN